MGRFQVAGVGNCALRTVPGLQALCAGLVVFRHFTLWYISLYRWRQTSVSGIAGKRVVKGGCGLEHILV